MEAFAESGVALAPDEDRSIRPWTARHVAIMRECAQAWQDVIRARRAYDAALRQPTA
jgi:hypothetical protein